MTTPLLEPIQGDSAIHAGRWMVTIYNNDHNTFDEVVRVLVESTGCGVDEALMEAWEAHHYGKAPVHFSSETECHEAAKRIAAIGVRTEVTPEWQD